MGSRRVQQQRHSLCTKKTVGHSAAGLTDPNDVATLVEHVYGDVVVVDTSGLRVDAGEALPAAALLVGCILTRAGAAVPTVVVALGYILWKEGHERRRWDESISSPTICGVWSIFVRKGALAIRAALFQQTKPISIMINLM